MNRIKCIAFDLDDTLLDTSQLLVPAAARRACQEMLAAGVEATIEECLTWRAQMAAEHSHTEIFRLFIEQHACPNPELALQNALKAFYNPAVPSRLPLMEGAEQNLRELSKTFSLYLVTSGDPNAQMEKINALGISDYFKKIYIVDTFKDETKQQAFVDILSRENISPNELLSIGNRLSQEIRHAKMCGSQTCYFCYGEHVGERPVVREDYPDFTVYKHSELGRMFSVEK
ncbi:MAG: HAD family hydrolase [Proteobacteria bacterium]|nr:MAG: HAD family hydrolase [Pseudomonadota bacterium]